MINHFLILKLHSRVSLCELYEDNNTAEYTYYFILTWFLQKHRHVAFWWQIILLSVTCLSYYSFSREFCTIFYWNGSTVIAIERFFLCFIVQIKNILTNTHKFVEEPSNKRLSSIAAPPQVNWRITQLSLASLICLGNAWIYWVFQTRRHFFVTVLSTG